MESVASRKSIKGFRKVPQYQDILNEELKNAKKTILLPERYVFLATQAAEVSSDVEKQLADQKQRVMTAFQDDHNKRSGDTPIIVTEARQGEQGVSGPAGATGVQGPPGIPGQTGPQGPPGPAANVNLDPVLREMHQRLDQ